MSAAEVWRAIPGYEGRYEVSDMGNVRSLNRILSHGRRWRGKTMNPTPMPRGYLTVRLAVDNAKHSWLIHRLVLIAFVGPAPEGSEARHRDGDPANNRLENLAWGTHSENEFDKVLHGRNPNTSKTHCPSGHPYDGANTYVHPGKPHRTCRTCRRVWQARYSSKKKDRAA